MERILDIYQAKYDETRPLICMDEASKQVLSDINTALPMSPGHPRREDHHYERKDVRAIFLFVDPLRGWRRASNRESRKRRDWAQEVKQLLDVDYPQAELVTLVCDNLNTHDIASLYAAFDAATAHRLAKRLRIEHTPRNGSWLNMAEMELSILSRQCIGRRFQDSDEMSAAMTAWENARNEKRLGASWRFTTADARIKLKALYPMPDK
jgi:hypothetical protein